MTSEGAWPRQQSVLHFNLWSSFYWGLLGSPAVLKKPSVHQPVLIRSADHIQTEGSDAVGCVRNCITLLLQVHTAACSLHTIGTYYFVRFDPRQSCFYICRSLSSKSLGHTWSFSGILSGMIVWVLECRDRLYLGGSTTCVHGCQSIFGNAL